MVRQGFKESTFNIEEIERILQICTIKPAVNQIELHPYCRKQNYIK